MAQITEIENNNSSKRNLRDYYFDTNQSENKPKTKFQIECETAISLEEAEDVC